MIDTFLEHTSLLHAVYKGVCSLSSKSIPERTEEMFAPYLLESMDFEFIQLRPVEVYIRKPTETNEERLARLRRKNVRLAPVSNVFEQFLERIFFDIRLMKAKIDFAYLIVSRKLYALINACIESEASLNIGQMCALCLMSLI